MTVHFKSFVFLMVGACGLIAALAWAGVRAISQHGEQTYEGYFAPVYSPDGQYVYFIERRSNGVVKQTSRPSLFLDGGPKFAVSVAKDAFSLKRLHVQSGQVEELTALSPSPIEGRNYEAIGSPFHSPDARLSYKKDGQLEFKVCLTVHQVPLARNYSSIGVWSESRHAAEISQSWKETHCETGGYNEWPISGDWELTAVRGEVGFSPAAIVAFNHVTGEVKALVKNKDYDRLYPKGFSLQELQKYSQRAAIERLQAMLRTHEELLQKYKAMGMSEVPALLQTGKDMQRLGYWPKSTTIVARQLSPDEAAKADKDALFSIAKEEMASGIFPDIEKAIARPGEEIDHDTSGYYIHRDYNTTVRLNAYLQTGKTRFYVRYLGHTYELTIKKPVN